MAEFVEVRGLRELEKNLNMLGEEMRKKGVRLMMSRASVPMMADAKSRAPVLKTPDQRRRPGTLRNNIRIWLKKGTKYAVTYYVGVRALSRKKIAAFKRSTGLSAAENPDDPFYWRFLEFGTSKMDKKPFLRPAFESKKHVSVQVAREQGREFIRKTALKFKRIK